MMKLKSMKLLRWRWGMIAPLVLSAATTVAASEITFEIGGTTGVKSGISLPFDVLNGTALQGQTLSINFIFGNGHFGRLFSVTDSSLAASLTLNTNWSGLVGFLDGTGYLFDQQGHELQSPQMLGSASSSSGTMFAGLFPLQSGNVSRPLDFFGIHFDLTLPNNPSVMLAEGSTFDLSFSENNANARFGIGPGIPQDIVPDAASTLYLLSIGLVAIVAARLKVRARGIAGAIRPLI
jgi:hypothetical protein